MHVHMAVFSPWKQVGEAIVQKLLYDFVLRAE